MHFKKEFHPQKIFRLQLFYFFLSELKWIQLLLKQDAMTSCNKAY